MTPILVVEDEPAIRHLIVDLLEAEGYDVIAAGDGQAGVDLAIAERPALVLMDLHLPVMSGVEAIKALKADPATQTIRTVAMSAGTNLLQHLDDLPADGVLAKPFDIEALLAVVAVHSRRPGTGPLGG
jgi:CheY-like chemotaxis protein